ncbi:MAG: hypothetical protein J6Y82_10580 [Bacteroidales bacterium]|nr:hypothetical protein [Bacteroidales bacterium]
MTPEQITECTAAIHVEIEHALNKTIPMKVANLGFYIMQIITTKKRITTMLLIRQSQTLLLRVTHLL